MTSILLQHLALASLTILFLSGIQLLLERLVSRDAIIRYTVGRCLLVVSLLLLPVQVGWIQMTTTQPPLHENITVSTAEDLKVMRDHNPNPASVPSTSAAAESPAAFANASSLPPVIPLQKAPTFHSLVITCYFVGVFASLLVLLLRIVVTWQVLCRCQPIDEGRISSLLSRIDHPGRLTVLQSESVMAPACIMLWRRTIILPASDDLDDAKLLCVLRHELIHLNRHDSLTAWLQFLLVTIYWFHPAAWWFCRLLDRNRELSCDAAVIRQTGLVKTYAETLLHLHERVSVQRRTPPLLLSNNFHSSSSLKRRLEMLANSPPQLSNLTKCFLVFGAAVTTAVLFLAQTHLASAAGIAPIQQVDDAADTGPQRATTEIRARKEGRSAAEMYAHLTESFRRHGITIKGSITNQETVVAAENAQVLENSIVARDIYVNLPEGSKLRATLTGDQITIVPSDDKTTVTIEGGSVVVYGPEGVVRFQSDPDNPNLLIEATIQEEVSIRLRQKRPDGTDLDVKLLTDLKTGIPDDEQQPPHNAVRYAQLEPEHDDRLFRIKMQWIYDMKKLKEEATAENNEKMELIRTLGID